MSEAQLIYNCFKEPKYFEGVRDVVNYLSKEGNGLGKLRKIVEETEQYQKELSNEQN